MKKSNKKYTEEELLKGMTPHSAHADLISSPNHRRDEFFVSEENVSDVFMSDKEQSQNEVKRYFVPLSRVRREFSSWFQRIKSGNTIVIITRNGKAVAEMVPYKRLI